MPRLSVRRSTAGISVWGKIAVCGLIGLFGAVGSAGAVPVSEVAITFDDVPSHNVAPAGVTRTEIVQKVVDALKKAKAPPVYGFVNAVALKDGADTVQALKVWRASGNLIGNHTYTHGDPNDMTADAFIADIRANEATLKDYAGDTDWHFLRLPFLRAGDTPQKRAELAAFMNKEGYRIADVSFGFNDYDYNPPYARCLAKEDSAGIEWLKSHYLAAAAAAMDQGRMESRQVFGRDTKHVFLLHIGAFDAEMLPAVLNLLKAKRFKLVTLEEAQSDPVYASYAQVREAWGGGIQQRAAFTKGVALPPGPDNFTAQLNALCQ